VATSRIVSGQKAWTGGARDALVLRLEAHHRLHGGASLVPGACAVSTDARVEDLLPERRAARLHQGGGSRLGTRLPAVATGPATTEAAK
jgi:hypothetical protein